VEFNPKDPDKMAKIVEEKVVIKVSKIVRDDANDVSILPEEFVFAVEAMAQEILSDPAAVIEVGIDNS
jgi:hypothetical protein